MIIEMNSLSMAEAKEIAEASSDNEEIINFMKKFVKLDKKQSKELRKELQELALMKVKEEHISQIIDLLPEDAIDLNKIFVDVSLDENEITKLLEIVKKYK